jgi:hypothetical protein
MKSQRKHFKIFLDEDDISHIDDYLDVNGGSVQSYIEKAVKKAVQADRVEQYLKDESLNKN